VIDQRRTVAEVARELGLVEQTLGNWVRQERVDRSGRDGLGTEEREEMAERRREVKRLTTERDLLKRGSVPDPGGLCGGRGVRPRPTTNAPGAIYLLDGRMTSSVPETTDFSTLKSNLELRSQIAEIRRTAHEGLLCRLRAKSRSLDIPAVRAVPPADACRCDWCATPPMGQTTG
jgi:hypothetical protein